MVATNVPPKKEIRQQQLVEKGRPKVAPVAKRLDIYGVQISTPRQGAGPAAGGVSPVVSVAR